jgi:hypothetical protein
MSMWIITACFLFCVIASAQIQGGPAPAGPVGLVSFVPGAALTAQQVEERTRTLQDGTSSTEVLKASIYRDNKGRTRIERSVLPGAAADLDVASIFDPVAHTAVTLLMGPKIAYRVFLPSSSAGGFVVALPALGVGEARPTGKLRDTAEALGKRVMYGIEVEGVRSVQTSEGQQSPVRTEEMWSSQTLGVVLQAEAAGSNWKHTARLENVDRREPDSALFAIPSDYQIRDAGGARP